MRLRRLDLTRYGKFTDFSLDFGAAPESGPDFHIVYGLNEAGKSTAFSAYLDLLFGIPERSPYNFLHAYNLMQVGAELEIDGKPHDLVRLKQRNNALIDSRGQGINEALLSSALGGLSRESYRTMFSLDDRSLRDGGAAIVESKGDLGELLFSASAGLADASRTLATVAEEAQQIHKKRARNTRIAELKRRLAELKEKREEIDTFASAFAGLVASRTQAEKAYDEALAELSTARTRHDELAALKRALPLAADLARLNAGLERFAGLPRPPQEWTAMLADLMRDETRLQTQIAGSRTALLKLEDEVNEIVIDETLLPLAGRIAGLDDLKARFRGAENDLPKRRLALGEQNALVATILKTLGQADHEDPSALLLPAALVGTLRDLIETRSGIEATRKTAEREHENAARAVEEVEGRLGDERQAGLGPSALRRLETLLDRLEKGDRHLRLAAEEKEARRLDGEFREQFAALAPWSGAIDELRRIVVPDRRRIEAWRTASGEIEKRITRHADQRRDLETERREVAARIAVLTETGQPIDDESSLAARQAREKAWQAHLTALNAETASHFETTLRRDDALTEARLERSGDLAELRQLQKQDRLIRSSLEREDELFRTAIDVRDALLKDLKASLPAELTRVEEGSVDRLLSIAETWLERRRECLFTAEALQEVTVRRDALRDEHTADTQALTTVLAEALAETDRKLDPNADLRRLLDIAGDLVAEARTGTVERGGMERRLTELQAVLKQRRQAMDDAIKASESWTARWRESLARTWFAEETEIAPVRAILDALTELPAALRERDQLAQRITQMERDRQAFIGEIAELHDSLGLSFDANRVLEMTEDLGHRLSETRNARDLRTNRERELQELRHEAEQLADALALHEARRTELTGFFDVETLTDVSRRMEDAAERLRLERRADEIREQIARDLRAPDFETAEKVLAGIDETGIEREFSELTERIENLGERSRVLFAELTRARDRLDAVGGDDAVAAIEAERATVLLEIEDLALRHLKLRTGALAAEKALILYREKHRSSMMARASEAFRLVTKGEYSGLATRPEKDREILIGVAKDGASKLSDAMSTGTRYQLYLALRFAGYEEFAAVRPTATIPFVADDIMETFDEPRSEEVFRLFGQMAGLGQVIYLTHHRHLCDIARDVVPGVRIHEL